MITNDTLHAYPPPPSFEEFRNAVQSLHGSLLRCEHEAEANSLRGDAHTRSFWRGEQEMAHKATAGLALLLWGAS